MATTEDDDLYASGRQQAPRLTVDVYPKAEQEAGGVLRLHAGEKEWIAALSCAYVDTTQME